MVTRTFTANAFQVLSSSLELPYRIEVFTPDMDCLGTWAKKETEGNNTSAAAIS